MAEGRLVQPFQRDTGQPTRFGYYLVYPASNQALPKVAAFRDWMRAEIAD